MTSSVRVSVVQQHEAVETLRAQALQAYTTAACSCGPYSPIHRIYHALAARMLGAPPSEQIGIARSVIACMEAFATLNSADAAALAVDAAGPARRRGNGRDRDAFRAAMSAHPALAAFQRWDDGQQVKLGPAPTAPDRIATVIESMTTAFRAVVDGLRVRLSRLRRAEILIKTVRVGPSASSAKTRRNGLEYWRKHTNGGPE